MQLLSYGIYLIISGGVTILVGKHLHKHGYFLILNLFEHEGFTKAVNNFLLMGYYLLNLGYLALTVKDLRGAASIQKGIELLTSNIGFILLLLGYMHISNILFLELLSKKKERIIKMFNQ